LSDGRRDAARDPTPIKDDEHYAMPAVAIQPKDGAATLPKASPPKSNPVPGTLATIRGYPDRLKIYRIPASPFWWCRATFGDRRITRSTKASDKKGAIAFAKEFYGSLLQRDSSIPLTTSRSFERCALALLDEHKRRANAGERNPRFADDFRKHLNHRILPFFKSYPLKTIDYRIVSRFVDDLRSKGATSSTVQRHLGSLRLVLKHAIKLGLIETLPLFPVITTKDNPRPWFSDDEYRLVRKTAVALAKEGVVIKGEPLTLEVRDFIVFMVNTFLRPSDWYNLRRRQVRIQERRNGHPLVVISPASSKTVNSPIISMPTAVPVYKRIVERQDSVRHHDEDAFVFLPHIENRDRARDQMRRFFDHVVRKANLKTAHTGKQRTIYSLRHTAIAFRLLKGQDVDLLFLARNCRTSVAMIDRFYCRHLSALMAPEKIIGMKEVKRVRNQQPDGQRGIGM
jgi:site-specific recombinase XerD